MSIPFNPRQGLVIVTANLTGPSGAIDLRMAVDTGAMGTLVSDALLVALGYDPSQAPQRVKMTTASGVEFVPRLPMLNIKALGQNRVNFPVLCHTLPPTATVDGLLGLDFCRGRVLTIDFQNGQITLA